MSVTEDYMSWKGIQIITSHLSIQKANVNLAPERPSDGCKTFNIHEEFIVCWDYLGIWQVLSKPISIAYLRVTVVDHEKAST